MKLEKNFRQYFGDHKVWSNATFGPPEERGVDGVIDHLRKEADEISAAPFDVEEWADIVILSIDGVWRSGFSFDEIIHALVFWCDEPSFVNHALLDSIDCVEIEPSVENWANLMLTGIAGGRDVGKDFFQTLVDKQQKNFNREWPDWRTAEPGKAIEHIRDSP